MSIKDFLEITFQGFTAFAIIFAARQIQINRKQLNLSVLEKCIRDFRTLEIQNAGLVDSKTAYKYIDLVNEELFYIQRNYLPDDVSKEWIDGMLDYMALMNSNHDIINIDNCLPLFNQTNLQCIENFPRLRKSFVVSNIYKWELIYSKESSNLDLKSAERKKVVAEILKNVKMFKF